jgi:ribosomal protein S18 acetylase RimI-like enzyme
MRRGRHADERDGSGQGKAPSLDDYSVTEEPLAIRRAVVQDAPALAAMLTQLDRDTPFMMFEPGERDPDPGRLAHWVGGLDAAGDCYLVLFRGAQALGFVHAERGRYRRNQHSAVVVIGMLPEARGAGWGRRLLGEVDRWAAAVGVVRLELTVMVHNSAAITLYERSGYRTEGRRTASLQVDREFVDELAMAKVAL